MKMYVLDLGRMHMDKSLLVANWQLATRTNQSPRQSFVEFPVSAYYIDHPDGKILFDAGCNPSAMGADGRWPEWFQDSFPWHGSEECHLPNRLAQLGVGLDDLRYVVLSHMHNDHCGCVEYFTKSQIIVHTEEISAALRAYALHDNSGPYIWKDTDQWAKKQLNWRLVSSDEGDLEVADNVTILNWGSGHASGMLGLHIRLPDTGGVILTSDAIYCALNYGPPIRQAGVVYDTAGWARTVQRIRNLAQRTKSQVWFGHDLDQFNGLRHSQEGSYE